MVVYNFSRGLERSSRGREDGIARRPGTLLGSLVLATSTATSTVQSGV